MKKHIYILSILTALASCLVSCKDEWKDKEQFEQMASFKAITGPQGVTTSYLRYKAQGKVRYELPIVMSGSIPNSKARTIHIGLDPDTLARLNQEQYGHRQELYFRQLDPKHYDLPKTITIPEGATTVTLPIDFTLADLDQVEKWVLPLQILDDPSYDYKANPNKQYRRAMLRLTPFNDYSGTYGGTLYRIFLENDPEPLTLNTHRTFVVDDKTIFAYAGTRDIDYVDRHLYKVMMRFTDDQIDFQKRKLEIWSDNASGNKFKVGAEQSYYTISEERNPTRPYLKHIYITLFLSYEFEDYTAVPGRRLKYKVEGTLSMQRDINTLIPNEDQQIQW